MDHDLDSLPYESIPLFDIVASSAVDIVEEDGDEVMKAFTFKVPPRLMEKADEILAGNGVTSRSKFIRKVFEHLVAECEG